MNKEKFERIVRSDVDCNSWAVLCLIKQEENYEMSSQVIGWMTLLQKKGYIDGASNITEKGLELIKNIEGKDVITFEKAPEEEKPVEFSLEAFSIHLIKQLKAKLKELRGREQIEGFGRVFFIPLKKEMMEFLSRCSRDYEVNLQENADKIEKILIAHLEKCCKTNQFAPAIKYYIIKDKTGSPLAAALESYEEKIDEKAEGQFNIINTKDLFA